MDDKMELQVLKGTVTFASWKVHTVWYWLTVDIFERAESRVISRRELLSGITPLLHYTCRLSQGQG